MTTSTPPVAAPAGEPQAPARAIWIPVAIILAAAAAGAGLVASVWGDLPDPIAHHWGADGKPNQWGPLRTQFTFALFYTSLFPLGMLGFGFAMRRGRTLAPVAAGIGVFVSALFYGMLYAQRGIRDAKQAPDAGWPLWVGVGGGLVAALLVWLTTRDNQRYVAARGPAPEAPHVDVAPGTRLAWTGSTRSSAGVWAAALLGLVPTLLMAVLFTAMGNPSVGVLMLLLTLVIAALLSNLRCRVSIDARGLRALGFGMVPWVRTPLESIQEARVAPRVHCLGEFGGWGYRGKNDGSGAWGLVTGDGEALVVDRAGKAPLYVTIDDAEEAAAVLNTLVTRLDGRPQA